jgi:two-component system, chemotaxis family, protein-glutamate methylesterase/glutaminase
MKLVPKVASEKSEKIKVLLVDDSTIALNVLHKILAAAPEIEVVGTAKNGQDALELIPLVQPAVVCTDLHMPVMDGLQLTREIMARYPRPILVLSVSVGEDSHQAFDLLKAGAVDVFPKPRSGLDSGASEFAAVLAQKLKILSGVQVFRKTLPSTAAVEPPTPPASLKSTGSVRLVVVGTSTGGPPALRTILAGLPANFSLPIVCVQHISAGFLPGLLKWLNLECRLQVQMACSGEKPRPGVIYFPPDQHHLLFDRQGRFIISQAPPVDGHRPSATVTMKSAAAIYGPAVLGILLTGMGKDGAVGLLDIARAGGITIAQDEASSVVFGMPKQAIALGAARYVMSLNEIADTLKYGVGIQKIGGPF